jgi:hypothetical protein
MLDGKFPDRRANVEAKDRPTAPISTIDPKGPVALALALT